MPTHNQNARPDVAAASVNFDWITPYMAVGGRLDCSRVAHWAEAHHIRAVVDLREEDCDDLEALRQHGVDLLHLPTEDNCAVAQQMLDKGVAFARIHLASGARVLMHCEHGIGRSATLALCTLVAEGIAPMDALSLMKEKRPCISPSPAQYEGWCEWLRRNGKQPPVFAEFCEIAYRHLKG